MSRIRRTRWRDAGCSEIEQTARESWIRQLRVCGVDVLMQVVHLQIHHIGRLPSDSPARKPLMCRIGISLLGRDDGAAGQVSRDARYRNCRHTAAPPLDQINVIDESAVKFRAGDYTQRQVVQERDIDDTLNISIGVAQRRRVFNGSLGRLHVSAEFVKFRTRRHEANRARLRTRAIESPLRAPQHFDAIHVIERYGKEDRGFTKVRGYRVHRLTRLLCGQRAAPRDVGAKPSQRQIVRQAACTRPFVNRRESRD